MYDLVSLSPCSNDEADSHMLLHTDHALHYGHHSGSTISVAVDTDMVLAVDTDMVLAVSVAQGLGPEYKLWLAFGTGKQFQYLAALKIASGLGSKKAHYSQCFIKGDYPIFLRNLKTFVVVITFFPFLLCK